MSFKVVSSKNTVYVLMISALVLFCGCAEVNDEQTGIEKKVYQMTLFRSFRIGI